MLTIDMRKKKAIDYNDYEDRGKPGSSAAKKGYDLTLSLSEGDLRVTLPTS